MNKKTILIVLIVVCALALIFMTLAGGPPGEIPPPPLPMYGGNMPAGHPPVAGTEMAAPDFELKGLDGRTVRLSELRGKAILLNFWSTTCPPCRWEIPDMEKLVGLMSGKPFELLAVTADPARGVEKFLSRNGHNIPVYLDETGLVHQQYGAFSLPATFVISPEGIVVNKVVGAANWGDQSVIDYFDMLIKESQKDKASEEDDLSQDDDGNGHKTQDQD